MACNQLEGLVLVTSKGTKAAPAWGSFARPIRAIAEHTLVVVIPKSKIQTITVTTELTSWSKTCIPEPLIKEFLIHVKFLIGGLLIMQLKGC